MSLPIPKGWHTEMLKQPVFTFTHSNSFTVIQAEHFNHKRTCGTVTFPVRVPACTSMSQAYSSVSLPAGKPSAENIAWARICRPERLRCPSHNTPSTAGRCTIKRNQNSQNYLKTECALNKEGIYFTNVTSSQPGSCR